MRFYKLADRDKYPKKKKTKQFERYLCKTWFSILQNIYPTILVSLQMRCKTQSAQSKANRSWRGTEFSLRWGLFHKENCKFVLERRKGHHSKSTRWHHDKCFGSLWLLRHAVYSKRMSKMSSKDWMVFTVMY